MEKDNLLVETVRTTLAETEAFYYLREAWFYLYNGYPTKEQLCVLLAKVALEAGRFKFCYNWNYGNIKKTPNHTYCMYECGEVINGKHQMFYPPHPQTHFNAYDSPITGAIEYIQFVSGRARYLKAWNAVWAGDPREYSHQLKLAGYYTADEEKYTKAVVSIYNEYLRRYDTLLSNAKAKDFGEGIEDKDADYDLAALNYSVAKNLDDLVRDLDFSLTNEEA